MQSASAPPTKWSDLMRRLNTFILYLCAGLFLLCITAATVNVSWQSSDSVKRKSYMDVGAYETGLELWIVMSFYYFLLLYQIVPISLYVSMTTVKFIQSMFMQWDTLMYHAESNSPAMVRSMALNEELGQVSYVFTDKTGTLTCNVMDFRKCSINGKSYGTGMCVCVLYLNVVF